jgi:hypothetical protein
VFSMMPAAVIYALMSDEDRRAHNRRAAARGLDGRRDLDGPGTPRRRGRMVAPWWR